jgi:molecular chaperone DnaJ
VIDPYAVLRVSPHADITEIRAAYRTRMREAHPDGGGAGNHADVARIAEAWSILSSPTKRAAHDALVAAAANPRVNAASPPTGATPPYGSGAFAGSSPLSVGRARFPWRFVVAVAAGGAALVVLLHIVGGRNVPRGPDGLVGPGSCIALDAVGAGYEVDCAAAHIGVARELVPFDAACDSDTVAVRDRQGMGMVCLEQ